MKEQICWLASAVAQVITKPPLVTAMHLTFCDFNLLSPFLDNTTMKKNPERSVREWTKINTAGLEHRAHFEHWEFCRLDNKKYDFFFRSEDYVILTNEFIYFYSWV